MAQKSPANTPANSTADLVEAVGPRQPCPCGSGKRYKACHGAKGGARASAYVARPFEGMPSECDVIALRELVPAATVELTVPSAGDRSVRLCTLLPGAVPALVRESGDIWLGLQVRHNFGDPARDLGAVLQSAIEAAEAGESGEGGGSEGGAIGLVTAPGAGPRLQELVADKELKVTVHDGFGYWIDDLPDADASVHAALEQANGSIHPTAKLASVAAAYWTNVGNKEHLRWVMPQAEDELLDALARLHAAGEDRLVADSRLVGMFRAHGLLTPVWDLPVGTGPEAIEDPAEAFGRALVDALADSSELTGPQRSARAGLANRQVTIR